MATAYNNITTMNLSERMDRLEQLAADIRLTLLERQVADIHLTLRNPAPRAASFNTTLFSPTAANPQAVSIHFSPPALPFQHPATPAPRQSSSLTTPCLKPLHSFPCTSPPPKHTPIPMSFLPHQVASFHQTPPFTKNIDPNSSSTLPHTEKPVPFSHPTAKVTPPPAPPWKSGHSNETAPYAPPQAASFNSLAISFNPTPLSTQTPPPKQPATPTSPFLPTLSSTKHLNPAPLSTHFRPTPPPFNRNIPAPVAAPLTRSALPNHTPNMAHFIPAPLPASNAYPTRKMLSIVDHSENTEATKELFISPEHAAIPPEPPPAPHTAPTFIPAPTTTHVTFSPAPLPISVPISSPSSTLSQTEMIQVQQPLHPLCEDQGHKSCKVQTLTDTQANLDNAYVLNKDTVCFVLCPNPAAPHQPQRQQILCISSRKSSSQNPETIHLFFHAFGDIIRAEIPPEPPPKRLDFLPDHGFVKNRGRLFLKRE